MPESYFYRFPNLYYDGKLCKDITRRVQITEGERSSPYIFYPYELKDQLRPDLVSEYYYEDAYMDWLILLSNKIIDPYYGWYNTNDEFNNAIREKYGSEEYAQKKIAFYRNNWASDDQQLTPEFYNNTLLKSWRKYYEPVFSQVTKILYYRRKQEDTVTNTNRILQYDISSNNNSLTLEVGELVDVKSTGLDGTIGTGEVETSNSSIVRIKNVNGDISANSTNILDIVGETTGANVSVNNSVIFFENFSNAEVIFWEPISYYDLELEENEQRKNLKLIGDGVAQLFVEEFTRKVRDGVDESTGLVEE